MALALTRRSVLTGAGAAAVAVTGGAWSVSSGTPAAGLRVLTAVELRVVEALSEILFPGVHIPLGGLAAGVPAEVDRLVAEILEPAHAMGFRYILRALEWGTLASRGRRFTDLVRADQLDVLETWIAPDVLPRRIAGDAIKVLLGMAYFANPAVQAAIGWRTGCTGAS